jgi:tRNA (guanine26-N2/guanine27-N2)-dimethyltransferase
VITHLHANRLFSECYLQKEFFDLVDIDSFGGDSSFLRSALCVVKIGGLLYLTSTDGRSSGGHRPSRYNANSFLFFIEYLLDLSFLLTF